ncbi:HK97-gp10 family putative phage morphogenesis protein [Galactobacter valiniphilus]|uniref:HK97-gp10 family putative phage morphogenesis protein n=1 Tax=Galactobacter valiniphilus TaxID=2676122 RepID=UPI0037358588
MFDFSDAKDFGRKLNRAAPRLQPLAQKVVAKVAHDVTAQAVASAPHDTGALQNSIKPYVSGLSAEVRPGVNYAHYVELGTSKMAAQPYLFPALDRNAQSFTTALAAAAKKVMPGG